MKLVWHAIENADTVRDPVVAFRLNALDDLIAPPGAANADDVWWIASLELEPDDEGNRRSIEHILENVPEPIVADVLIPPEYYLPEKDGKRELDPEAEQVTVIARRSFLNLANSLDERAPPIRRIELGGIAPRNMLDYARAKPEMYLGTGPATVPDGAAVVAVIDNGIAIGHNLFRKPGAGGVLDKTRVAFFWNMDGDEALHVPLPFPVPNPQQWTRAEIDALLAANMHGGQLDEAAFYAQIGLIDRAGRGVTPVAQRVSHGTHVMGLAAGLEPDDALIDKRPIIAVQLPTDLVRDVSGVNLGPAVKHALQYVRRAAKRFKAASEVTPPPVLVNFSFGDFAGPHDGTSEMELVLKNGFKSAPDRPRAVVLPSGNGNLSRCHAQIDLTATRPSMALNWRVQPEDLTISTVELWLPKLDTPPPDDLVSLRVDHPAVEDQVTVPSQAGAGAVLRAPDGTEVGRVAFSAPTPPTKRGLFTVSIRPTAAADRLVPLAPSGVWTLTLARGNGAGAGDLRLQSWILRDETLPGFPLFGRQSYFDDPGYVRFYRPGVESSPFDLPKLIGKRLTYDPADPGPVRRAGTQSGFACGATPGVVAGTVRSTGRAAAYSAGGPTGTAHRDGPDAAAASDDSPVLPGVLSAGSSSGSLVAMGGTSVAAPLAARWLAGQLKDNPNGRALIRDHAKAKNPNPRLPKIRAGEGDLDRRAPFGSQRRPGP